MDVTAGGISRLEMESSVAPFTKLAGMDAAASPMETSWMAAYANGALRPTPSSPYVRISAAFQHSSPTSEKENAWMPMSFTSSPMVSFRNSADQKASSHITGVWMTSSSCRNTAFENMRSGMHATSPPARRVPILERENGAVRSALSAVEADRAL